MSSIEIKYQTAEEKFRASFERLKADKPDRLPKGTKLSQANVAKEAGDHPTALKKDRYPSLILEIQDEISRRKIKSDGVKNANDKKRKTDKERLKDCQLQRDKLSNIVDSQEGYIEELLYEIEKMKKVRTHTRQ
ncbi:hypothetical protein [Thiomicrorhabdus sp.]|uniref:hypothetical protein n=1 Tax=Thiomicrorhabdus sp. TaxID=2039724 RepID=UPI003563552A